MRIGYAQDGKAGVAEGGLPLVLSSMVLSVSTKQILILSTLWFQFANNNLFESFLGVFTEQIIVYYFLQFTIIVFYNLQLLCSISLYKLPC